MSTHKHDRTQRFNNGKHRPLGDRVERYFAHDGRRRRDQVRDCEAKAECRNYSSLMEGFDG